jgi:hypothetical protein
MRVVYADSSPCSQTRTLPVGRCMCQILTEGTRLFVTECTVKNECHLLLQMLCSLIGIGLEVSEVSDCNQLEESF